MRRRQECASTPDRPISFSGSSRWFGEPPELALTNDGHLVPLRSETSNFNQLRSRVLTRDLLRVGLAAHQYVGQLARARLHDCTRLFRRGDCFISRSHQKTGERETLAGETVDSAEARLFGPLSKGGDQLTRSFVSFAARSKAAMDHFLQMIRAWEQPNVFAPHRLRDVAAEQHHRYQSDLIDVVALLPPAHFAPCDFTRHMEKTERVGSDTAGIELVRRNAKVAELQ